MKTSIKTYIMGIKGIAGVIMEDIFWIIVELIMGLVFLVYGIIRIIIIKNSSEEIKGIFIENRTVRGKGGNIVGYEPVFSYRYKKANYKTNSLDMLTVKEASKYIKNKEYKIYVNRKYPRYFVIKPKARTNEYVSIFFGLLMIALSILTCLGF